MQCLTPLVEKGHLDLPLSPSTVEALGACAGLINLNGPSPSLETIVSECDGSLVVSRPPHLPSCSCTQLLELLPCGEVSNMPQTAVSFSWAALMHAGMELLRAIEMDAGVPAGVLTELVCTSSYGPRASAMGDGTKWRWLLYKAAPPLLEPSQKTLCAHVHA